MSAFKYKRLNKDDAALLLVDHQAGLISLVQDFSPSEFKNNVLAVAACGKYFKLPTILTTSFETGPNGPLVPELKEMFPNAPYIARPGNINAAFARGVAPADTPVDETETDLLQGFAELQQPLGERVLSLRGGRQLLAYGSERLISTRYGLNVLRPFDGGVARLDAGPWRADALYARPVDTGIESFDDETGDDQALWSLYTSRALPLGQESGLDLYYIGYNNDRAVFNQGAGDGGATRSARGFGAARGWDWNFEVFYQFGDFDEDPADPDLQTFNPLFPKGKYFDEIGLLGPYNLIDVHPF